MPDEGASPVSDQVSAALAGLEDLPVTEHVEVFDRVHRSLQDALATLDEA